VGEHEPLSGWDSLGRRLRPILASFREDQGAAVCHHHGFSRKAGVCRVKPGGDSLKIRNSASSILRVEHFKLHELGLGIDGMVFLLPTHSINLYL